MKYLTVKVDFTRFLEGFVFSYKVYCLDKQVDDSYNGN